MAEINKNQEAENDPFIIVEGEQNAEPFIIEGDQKAEAENNPEVASRVNNAISKIEREDKSNPTLNSEWMGKAKKFAGNAAAFPFAVSSRFFLSFCAKLLVGVFNFAHKVIKKGGKVGFEEGHDIGHEAFQFKDAKGKKQK